MVLDREEEVEEGARGAPPEERLRDIMMCIMSRKKRVVLEDGIFGKVLEKKNCLFRIFELK